MKSLDTYVDALVIHLIGEWIATQVGYSLEKQRTPSFHICDSMLKETLHLMSIEELYHLATESVLESHDASFAGKRLHNLSGIQIAECAGKALTRRASLKAIETASNVEAAIEKISLRHPDDPVLTLSHLAFKPVPVLRKTVEICGMSFRMERSNYPMPCTVYSTGENLGYLKIVVKHEDDLPMAC